MSFVIETRADTKQNNKTIQIKVLKLIKCASFRSTQNYPRTI